MSILVTGADGFVGQHLVDAIANSGEKVLAACRTQRHSRSSLISPIQFDLLKTESWQVFSGLDWSKVQAVVHLAALMPGQGANEDEYRLANVKFTDFLSNLAVGDSVPEQEKAFVYFSTIGVFGNPLVGRLTEETPVAAGRGELDPYFETKYQGERVLLSKFSEFFRPSIFRMTSPFGPNMKTGSVLPYFVHRALKGKSLTWHGSGIRTQDFIYIDDVVTACLHAIETRYPGLALLSSSMSVSMKELAICIAAMFNNVDAGPSGEIDPANVQQFVAENHRLRQELGCGQIVQLADGLNRYRDALEHPDQFPYWWRRT